MTTAEIARATSSQAVLHGVALPEEARIIGRGVAFGANAIRYLASLPPELSIIACDGSYAEMALAEAVRRRREGIPTFVAPLITENRAEVARDLGVTLLHQFTSLDDRRGVFEALATGAVQRDGVEVLQMSVLSGERMRTLREFAQLGDAVVLRSNLEHSRLEELFKRPRQHRAVAPGNDPSIPAVRPDPDADRIVVWAPYLWADALGVIAYALSELHTKATFICHGSLPFFDHEFILPSQAHTALRRANVIIDAEIAGPGASIGFAESGFGIAYAATSGAHEFITGGAAYDPRDFRTIIAAVAKARADRRTSRIPRIETERHLAAVLVGSAAPQIANPPLVSIVVPTFNRRSYLEKMLQSFTKQTYPNFEVVVVNDAGCGVDDIVARFPFARLINKPENSGVVKTCNVGFRAARGDYLGVVADDDLLYPDHIARVMGAIASSGLAIAHGNIIVSLHTKLADGRDGVFGHHLTYDGSHDRSEALYAMPIHAAGYLIRRDVLAAVGYFSEHTRNNSDHDLTLKLSEKSDFAHTNFVTGEMRYRDDKSNDSAKAGNAHAQEVAEVLASHLPPDRPLIAKRQQQSVQGVLIGMQRAVFYEPHLRLEQPLPIT